MIKIAIKVDDEEDGLEDKNVFFFSEKIEHFSDENQVTRLVSHSELMVIVVTSSLLIRLDGEPHSFNNSAGWR